MNVTRKNKAQERFYKHIRVYKVGWGSLDRNTLLERQLIEKKCNANKQAIKTGYMLWLVSPIWYKFSKARSEGISVSVSSYINSSAISVVARRGADMSSLTCITQNRVAMQEESSIFWVSEGQRFEGKTLTVATLGVQLHSGIQWASKRRES